MAERSENERYLNDLLTAESFRNYGPKRAHPRAAPAAPPQGGATSGPAEPDPQCPLEWPALRAASADPILK